MTNLRTPTDPATQLANLRHRARPFYALSFQCQLVACASYLHDGAGFVPAVFAILAGAAMMLAVLHDTLE